MFFFRFKSLYASLKKCIERSASYSESNHMLFGLYAFFTYPLYYFIWGFIYPQPQGHLMLRVIASLLGLGLVLKRYWPIWLRNFFPLYWHLTLLYCIPFFFTYMTLESQGSTVWLLNTMTALFLMIVLLRWMPMLFVSILGIVLGVYGYTLTSFEGNITIDIEVLVLTYIPIVIAALIFMKKKEVSNEKQLLLLKTFGGSIAHELRTPLVGIRAGLQSFERFQPILSETYLQAQQKGEATGEIEPDQLELLNQVMTNMHYQTDNAFHIIELQLKNMSVDSVNSGEFKVCNITDIIKNALSEYPFNEQEQQLVHWKEDNDFNFYGDLTLTKHILWNLIKNALYYIKAARKGEIRIWLERGDKFNRLHFKDTAQGLSPDIAKKIFDQFFTNRTSGTGLGLAFCKLVMKAYGGDIHCIAKEGEFAEFILSFPKI